MRLVSVLVMLGLCTTLAMAAPDGWLLKPGDTGVVFDPDRATYPETEPNNTCATANQYACGDVINPAQISPAGDGDYYKFTTTAGTRLWIRTAAVTGQTTVDTWLELWNTDCTTRLAYDDDSGGNLYSWIQNFAAPYTGEYKIFVRAYGASQTGYYQMSLTCEEPPPPPQNDTCAMAEQNNIKIDRCTTGTLTGNTANFVNDYSPTNGCASGYAQQGKDAVYYMDLVAGDFLNMTYTQHSADTGFYILTNCADMNSCVVGADNTLTGQPETFTYTVPTTGRYYLILDAYGTNAGGPWTLNWTITCQTPQPEACCFADGTCQMLLRDECIAQGGTPQGAGTTCTPNPCQVVDAESTNWGAIKATYR